MRPKSPGNVGSVARAMKNMGFARLVVADPITYDDASHFDEESRRLAWQAVDVLEGRVTAPDLSTALRPFSLVAGTTSNPPTGARVLTPRELAPVIAGRLAGDPTAVVALLFGQEDIGLTREDLACCHVVGRIPSSPAYASLNLAQAALIFLYELRLALAGDGGHPGAPAAAPAPSHGEMEAFLSRLEEALGEIGFLHGASRDHMMRELRLLLHRALLTSREVAIFEGIVRQMLWAARRVP